MSLAQPSKNFCPKIFPRDSRQGLRTSIKSCHDTLQTALASASIRQDGLARESRIVIGSLPEHPSKRAAVMAKLGDAWYGKVSGIKYFIRYAVLVMLTVFTGNREGSKPTRRTHTGRSEIQLEKWGVLCPSDIEYASCTLRLHSSPSLLRVIAMSIILCIIICPLSSNTLRGLSYNSGAWGERDLGTLGPRGRCLNTCNTHADLRQTITLRHILHPCTLHPYVLSLTHPTSASSTSKGARVDHTTMSSRELIDAQFDRAVEIVQNLPKTDPIQTGYEEKLAMYRCATSSTIPALSSQLIYAPVFTSRVSPTIPGY